MNEARYTELTNDDDAKLTEDELNLGWHFCLEWDGLLVGPGMGEMETCMCVDRRWTKGELEWPSEAI